MSSKTPFAVAIVGMAGRFPGARDIDQFWENLRAGRESVSFFTAAELRAAGVSPRVYEQPAFVNAGAILDDIDQFDAEFFGFSASEAEITDPQHRLFLECSWEALENAGYDVDRLPGPVAVFAGAAPNSYGASLNRTPQAKAVGALRVMLGNDRAHLPTWVSYKLNLTGMSMNVQAACATSLAAVHLARQALLDRECDVALAGGVNITVPQKRGYSYEESGILSRDGHCRAFDADASGTVPGEGVGVVVLKRLEDAVRDRDTIRAVILGSAVNNDGAARVSFGAPGVNGVTEAIVAAHSIADVVPGEIGFVEAHGSGTSLGDSIEIAALREAFAGAAPGTIALGSVKTNIGHASAAAGVAALIKAVLALEHAEIPPSLWFSRENPRAPLSGSPFFINSVAQPWRAGGAAPRRAAVSSLGLGGTNVHVVLEEAPPRRAAEERGEWLGIWSAKTEAALEEMTDRLADYLRRHPNVAAADVAYTLQVGRKAFAHRRAVVFESSQELATLLMKRDHSRLLTNVCSRDAESLVFMLPGIGDQYARMGQGLYRSERVFREHVDRCADVLRDLLGVDLREVLYGGDRGAAGDPQTASWLNDARLSQPVMFAVEYALAKLWISWGVRPTALIGYSLGEVVAACLAEVLPLEDALRFVTIRARLMHSVAPGTMLAVLLSAEKLEPLLGDRLSLAAVNGPAFSVVSGPVDAVDALREELVSRGLYCRSVAAERAFHSSMMEEIVAPLESLARGIRLQPPAIPLISNVTGTWMTDEQATDVTYWPRQLCRPIRFWAGLGTLCSAGTPPVLLEIGPGQMLSSLVAQVPPGEDGAVPLAVPSMKGAQDPRSDSAVLLEAAGRLWATGVRVDWAAFSADRQCHRVPLPAYPFQRERYWIDAPIRVPAEESSPSPGLPSETDVPEDATSDRGERKPARAMRARPRLMHPYAPPSTPTEEVIGRCWEELFGVAPVGIHDQFIELGGNSLIGGQLALRIQSAFQVPFALEAVLRHPTVAAMAAHVEELLMDQIVRTSA